MEQEYKEILTMIKSKLMELIINLDLEEPETYEGDYSCFDQEESDIVNSFAF